MSRLADVEGGRRRGHVIDGVTLPDAAGGEPAGERREQPFC